MRVSAGNFIQDALGLTAEQFTLLCVIVFVGLLALPMLFKAIKARLPQAEEGPSSQTDEEDLLAEQMNRLIASAQGSKQCLRLCLTDPEHGIVYQMDLWSDFDDRGFNNFARLSRSAGREDFARLWDEMYRLQRVLYDGGIGETDTPEYLAWERAVKRVGAQFLALGAPDSYDKVMDHLIDNAKHYAQNAQHYASFA